LEDCIKWSCTVSRPILLTTNRNIIHLGKLVCVRNPDTFFLLLENSEMVNTPVSIPKLSIVYQRGLKNVPSGLRKHGERIYLIIFVCPFEFLKIHLLFVICRSGRRFLSQILFSTCPSIDQRLTLAFERQYIFTIYFLTFFFHLLVYQGIKKRTIQQH